jgi:anthranilate 1,2-dioxygenase reductase subunit
VLTCQTRAQSDAAFYFYFDSALFGNNEPSRLQGTVSDVQQVSPTTAILHVEVGAAGAALDYLPGQYAHLQVPCTEYRRSYSFACAPGSSNLQFLIRLLPSGVMTDYLRDRCQVGDVIHMEAPLGAFYLRHIDRPLVMVAGGIGLSAFLGMLDQIADQGGCSHRVHLYYGVRDTADLCEVSRIEPYAARIPGFRFTPVVRNPSTDWPGKTGFIAEHLELAELRDQPFDLYFCGPPPMVESIKDWRQQHGLDHSHLYLEKLTDSNS